MKLLLADDLRNESLFGIHRSLRLKKIALSFCSRMGAHLKILHVDDPNAFSFQEPLYKKYLAQAQLNQKKRLERVAGREVEVEYLLDEGEAIQQILKRASEDPKIVGIIAGTSNKYGMGRWIVGSRIKRLVKLSPLPVYIFGMNAVRSYNYDEGESESSHHSFALAISVEPWGLNENQIQHIKRIQKQLSAALVFFPSNKRTMWWWRKEPNLESFKEFFPDASFSKTRPACDLLALTSHFPISPLRLSLLTFPVVHI